MATIEQLTAALRNADALGDVEAAKTLAGEIRRMRTTDFSTQAQSLDEAGRAVARSKNDEFGNYLRAQDTQPKPGETPEQAFKRQGGSLSMPDKPGMIEGVARSVLQGLTFGMGDEAVAAGRAVLDPLVNNSGGTFSDRYNASVAQERRRAKQFQKENPITATGAEIVGSIPTAIGGAGVLSSGAQALASTAPLRAAAAAAPRLAALLRAGPVAGATVSALEGGAYGFGTGEGGVSDRATNALPSIGTGLAIGAVAPAVGAGFANVARNWSAERLAQKLGLSRPSSDILRRTMQADDSLTQAGEDRVRAAGPDAMLADSGASARRVLDTAMQSSGPGGRVAREAIDSRVGRAGRDIDHALDQTFGPTGAPVPQYGPEVKQLYRRAYNAPINYASPEGQLVEMLVRERVPQSAITKANALMRAEGEGSRQILIDVGQNGAVTLRQMPDVLQIDYITRGLNNIAAEASGRGAIGGTTDEGRVYGKLSGELRSLVRQLVPEYGDALNAASGYIREGKAYQLGSAVLSSRTTRQDIADAIDGMSDIEVQRVREGLRQNIDDAIANVQRTVQDPNVDARESVAVLKSLSSRANREKVAMIVGDAAPELFTKIDAASNAFDLRASVNNNSATFARQAMDRTMRAATDDGVINALRSGEVISKNGAVSRMAQLLMGRTASDKQRIYDETQEELARALTGPNALQLLTTLRQGAARPEINEQSARRLGELLGRSTAGATGALHTR